MKRPTSPKVRSAQREIGSQLRTWRKMLHLTMDQVAERANIARSTLQRIEKGDGGVSFESVLSTARALGILDQIVKATDSYETDFGRMRADRVLPERVRP